jgi:hypothetical protein
MAVQHAARSLNSSPIWILLSIIAIVWASLNLIFEVPRLDFCDDPAALAIRGIGQPVACRYLEYFYASNIVLAIFFIVELLVNACARGVYPVTPGSFFVTPAGVLDWWSLLYLGAPSPRWSRTSCAAHSRAFFVSAHYSFFSHPLDRALRGPALSHISSLRGDGPLGHASVWRRRDELLLE